MGLPPGQSWKGESLDSERETIKKAKKDLREFDSLYRKYFPRINNFVFHRVDDEALRADIVSNVFFKAMKKLTLFRFIDSRRCSFSSWLYRIAVNEVNQYYRDSRRNQMVLKEYRLNTVRDLRMGTDDCEVSLNYEVIRERMKTLSPEEQNLLTLRFFEKKSYRELSEIFGRKEGALKVRVHRIINKLRASVDMGDGTRESQGKIGGLKGSGFIKFGIL